MSDQEFRGIAPKTPAGDSIFFHSMDYWIGLCNCIRMIIDEEFPLYPFMDAESAKYVAEALNRRLEFGLVEAYFELAARRRAARRRLNDPEIPEKEIEAEVCRYVEKMLDWSRRYIVFLNECGGCEAI